MFDITKLSLKIPNFLTDQECDYLIKYYEDFSDRSVLETSTESTTEEVKQSSFGAVEVLPNTEPFFFVRKKTEEAIREYLKYLDGLGYFHKSMKHLFKYSHSYRVLKYDVGSTIHPHTDHDTFTYGSISINLNENYEGGVFTLFNGKHEVPLGKGDVFIFPADYFWTHEVTEVTKGSRYSLNSFLLRVPKPVQMKVLQESINYVEEYHASVKPQYILGPYNHNVDIYDR